jgi:hypothetical protein
MNRISPTGSPDLLYPVLAASGSADQFDPVQHCCRRQFLPERELQLCQVRENFAQKIRIIGVSNMVIRIAAWPSDVAGDGSHNEELILTQLILDLGFVKKPMSPQETGRRL